MSGEVVNELPCFTYKGLYCTLLSFQLRNTTGIGGCWCVLLWCLGWCRQYICIVFSVLYILILHQPELRISKFFQKGSCKRVDLLYNVDVVMTE